MSTSLEHRQHGYDLLTGNGLEIGAFNQPAIIPKHCKIEYCDAQSREDAAKCFPELEVNNLIEVEHICDLDKKGLSLFEDKQFDFVIMNHVIEHVANPIKVIEEIFRITKSYAVISAPDKNFTFDKPRDLTLFSHLEQEYDNQVTEVTDEHYVDFFGAVHPHILKLTGDKLQFHINNVKKRREHAHVWDSNSFAEFMSTTINLLGINATCEFVSIGNENNIEYFSVWKIIS